MTIKDDYERAQAEHAKAEARDSETPPRSRDLTTYRILRDVSPPEDDFHTYADFGSVIKARSPEAAIAMVTERGASKLGDDPDLLVAVPDSAWHVFEKTTAWRKR